MNDLVFYIGFSSPRKWKIGAKAISWWMGKPYSHVYIRFVSKEEGVPSTVYHAAHGMVHFRSLSNFCDENDILREFEIPICKDTRRKILVNCMNLSGERYGYAELPKIFISDLAFHFFKKSVNFQDSKGYICSELVGKVLQDDLKFTFPIPLHILKPIHVEEKLLQAKYRESSCPC